MGYPGSDYDEWKEIEKWSANRRIKETISNLREENKELEKKVKYYESQKTM